MKNYLVKYMRICAYKLLCEKDMWMNHEQDENNISPLQGEVITNIFQNIPAESIF